MLAFCFSEPRPSPDGEIRSGTMSDFNSSIANSTAAGAKGDALVVIEFILFFLVGLVAFAGNVLIFIALYRNPLLRTVTNVFVFSLAITDLFMSLLVIPFAMVSVVERSRVLGDDGCQFNGIVNYILGGISLLILTQIAVNRYIRVVRPSLYPSIYTKRSAGIMVVCAGMITVILSMVAFIGLGVKFKQTVANPAHCNILYPSKSAVAFYTIVIFMYNVPTSIVIAVCYALVYRKIRGHNLVMKEASRKSDAARVHGVEESAMTKVFAAVLVGFYLCWIPAFIANVLNAVTAIKPDAHAYSTFYHLLPVYTSSMINPIIYATFSKMFRDEFFRIIRCESRDGFEMSSQRSTSSRQDRSPDDPNLLELKTSVTSS